MNDNITAYGSRFGGFVQMLPDELFLQITNLDADIAFAGNIKVELIDTCQEVMQDITSYFYYDEFTDVKGVKQIAFEFGNIGVDYHREPLLLKISHTVSDSVWYSNCFLITDFLKEETTHFSYTCPNYFKGISYDRANYFQEIRLQCFKNDVDVNTEANQYTQLSGNIISLRNIVTPINKYKFYICDAFTFNRMVALLNHDIVYIDSYRISNKPETAKGERIEDSNIFELNFESNPTEEFRLPVPQINIVIPICDATVSDISASLESSTVTVNWTNSTALFGVAVEISTDGQLTWHIPENLIIGMVENTCTYVDPLVSHHIRITPKCAEDSYGTAGIYLFEYPVVIVCVIPTLVSATKDELSNDVTYVWDTNGFDYLSGVAQLQYSTDGGAVWLTAATVLSNNETATVTITGVGLGDPIKYRVECNGNTCNGQLSNVITTTFGESGLPLTEYCIIGFFHEDDEIHVPPGGFFTYEDEFGTPIEMSGLTVEMGAVSVESSVEPYDLTGCDFTEC